MEEAPILRMELVAWATCTRSTPEKVGVATLLYRITAETELIFRCALFLALFESLLKQVLGVIVGVMGLASDKIKHIINRCLFFIMTGQHSINIPKPWCLAAVPDYVLLFISCCIQRNISRNFLRNAFELCRSRVPPTDSVNAAVIQQNRGVAPRFLEVLCYCASVWTDGLCTSSHGTPMCVPCIATTILA